MKELIYEGKHAKHFINEVDSFNFTIGESSNAESLKRIEIRYSSYEDDEDYIKLDTKDYIDKNYGADLFNDYEGIEIVWINNLGKFVFHEKTSFKFTTARFSKEEKNQTTFKLKLKQCESLPFSVCIGILKLPDYTDDCLEENNVNSCYKVGKIARRDQALKILEHSCGLKHELSCFLLSNLKSIKGTQCNHLQYSKYFSHDVLEVERLIQKVTNENIEQDILIKTLKNKFGENYLDGGGFKDVDMGELNRLGEYLDKYKALLDPGFF